MATRRLFARPKPVSISGGVYRVHTSADTRDHEGAEMSDRSGVGKRMPGEDGRAPQDREFRYLNIGLIAPGELRQACLPETLDTVRSEVLSAKAALDTSEARLHDHVQANGVYQPILVRPHPRKAGSFEIIDGQHRYDAQVRARDAVLLDPNGSSRVLSMIPAIIVAVDDVTACTMRVAADTIRVQITAWERGHSLADLSDVCENTADTKRTRPLGCRPLADLIGMSPSWCAQHTRLATNITAADLEAAGLACGGELRRDLMNAISMDSWTEVAKLTETGERRTLLTRYAERARSGTAPAGSANVDSSVDTVGRPTERRADTQRQSPTPDGGCRKRRADRLTYDEAGTLPRFSIECSKALRLLDLDASRAMLDKFSAPAMVCAEQVILHSDRQAPYVLVPMGHGHVIYLAKGTGSMGRKAFLKAMGKLHDENEALRRSNGVGG